jgi:hypothetical protein
MLRAYAAGKFAKSEAMALKMIPAGAAVAPGRQATDDELLARSIAAYSAARRKRFALARERFEVLRDVASMRPDHGKRPAPPGEQIPPYEEEAAYQHAACTQALGDRKGAEDELNNFICRYMGSSLIHGACKRIAHMHGGDAPKETVRRWKLAVAYQRNAEAARRREAAVCGPACVSELLRRRGQAMSVPALAREMAVNEKGASLLAMRDAAARHGLKARGVAMTWEGLLKQRYPLVALTGGQGHYVLVESASPAGVTVWDPALHDSMTVSKPVWTRQWTGYGLLLD